MCQYWWQVLPHLPHSHRRRHGNGTKRPLKWSDFKGNPAIKSTTSYFKGFLKTVTDIEHEGKTRFNSDVRFATSAVALMDCNASYADSAYRTDQMLRYHQLQFDMLEIVRRRLQADLNSGMTGIEADNRVAYYQRIYNEQTSDLARATVNGSNDQRLQQYEYMTRKQLEEQLLPSVPEVKPGDWQAGWFVGTGCLIPTGGISDLFNYAWLFNIGLSGGYKNLILKADISYGQPDIHNFTDYNFNPFNKTTAEAQPLSIAEQIHETAVGERLVRLSRHRRQTFCHNTAYRRRMDQLRLEQRRIQEI